MGSRCCPPSDKLGDVNKGKTVYILGAGASCEVNLPSGDKLRGEIAALLDLRFDFNKQTSGDRIIADALRVHMQQTGDSGDGGSYVRAAHQIRAGMEYAVSIDNYLHQHRGNKEAELCGKLSIVRVILESENGSLMHMQPGADSHQFPQSALASTWYSRLWQVLTDGCRAEDLEARFESIAFVIFNYDRCIENYLYHALQVFYGLSAQQAGQLLGSVEIHHPYGTVGVLPWQGNHAPAIAFGGTPHGAQLLSLSRLIKTFTESVDPSHSEIVAIQALVRSAEKLVILGFAFYQQNMDLLWPGVAQNRSNRGNCYATAFGISASDLEIVREA